ncbi:hypothetical protein ACT4S2_00385 [Kocuria turfanensis]|uniref:hypothetical protein n=1 Tax=Kocuria turfanensis TaxID=388357 RepID=UPI004035004F
MNINFICVAKSDKGRRNLRTLTDAALAYAMEVFGPGEDRVVRTDSLVAFNADRMGRTWTVPTWLEHESGTYGFSQPPIPVNTVVTTQTWADEVVRLVDGREKLDEFVINHFGYHLRRDSSSVIWTDVLGFGRCYIVENDDFTAVSNHIGMLSFFLEGEVKLDETAIAQFASFGWFAADTTPFLGIRRVPAATRISISPRGETRHSRYLPLAELIGDRGPCVDFEPTVAQTRTVAKNLDNLSHRTPTVYLSGGQDSRMTAGLWLTGGSSANVVTLGVLEREVEIAKQLLESLSESIDFDRQGVTHRVTEPSPTSVTMDIEERLQNAFKMWDGDAAPTKIKTNVNIPSGGASLAIGGTNGEITHGYFYSRPGVKEQIEKLPHPLKRLERVYSGVVPTESAYSVLPAFFDAEYEEIRNAGQPGLASLDVFYLREKLRRWHNQSLSGTSPVVLGSTAYIRAAFDLTVQQRIDKLAPKTIAKMAVPEWDGVPYYKATVGEGKVANRKGLRTWHIDKDYLYAHLGEPSIWHHYLRKERIDSFLKLVEEGEAVGSHESWFNRAIWIDYLPTHATALNRRVMHARHRAV